MSPSQTVLSGDEEEKEKVDKAEVVEEPPEMGTEDPMSTSQTVNLKVHPNSNISMHIPHAPYGTFRVSMEKNAGGRSSRSSPRPAIYNFDTTHT